MSVNSLPRNASIRVFVIVPTISRPMFIPDLNSSFAESLGFAACTSSSDEDMLMETSMTAPSAHIMILATSRPLSSSDAPAYLS